MGVIRKFNIVLTLPTCGKCVYRQGEVVKGTVILEASAAFSAKSVRIRFRGEAQVKWSETKGGVAVHGSSVTAHSHSEDKKASETYVNLIQTLWGLKSYENGPAKDVAPGVHRFPFSFKIPEKESWPSTVTGPYGAVRYWLEVEVVRPLFRFNERSFRSIFFLSNITADSYKSGPKRSDEKTLSKALGLGKAGHLRLRAELDRGAYSPFGRMLVTLSASNDSTKDLGEVRACVVRKTTFTVGTDTQVTKKEYWDAISEKIPKGGMLKWDRRPYQMPRDAPSTVKNTCHIINVKYYLKVWVKVPWGLDLELHVPFIMATVPPGCTVSPPVPGKADGLQRNICYTTYEAYHWSDGWGDFPNSDVDPVIAVDKKIEQAAEATPSAKHNALASGTSAGAARQLCVQEKSKEGDKPKATAASPATARAVDHSSKPHLVLASGPGLLQHLPAAQKAAESAHVQLVGTSTQYVVQVGSWPEGQEAIFFLCRDEGGADALVSAFMPLAPAVVIGFALAQEFFFSDPMAVGLSILAFNSRLYLKHKRDMQAFFNKVSSIRQRFGGVVLSAGRGKQWTGGLMEPGSRISSTMYNDVEAHTAYRQDVKDLTECAAVLVEPVPRESWEADDTTDVCSICNVTQFSFVNRKHHCRACGQVVCGDCSPNTWPARGSAGVVRVCCRCLDGLRADKEERHNLHQKLPMIKSVYVTKHVVSFDFVPSAKQDESSEKAAA